MPCEACNTQFTVFKRKKSCTECRRFYCNNCLIKNKDRALCERCVIFTTRPLTKIILLKLKAKDLIFYLQSKHISTKGCVEKEELVNLVLIHVNNPNSYSPDSQSSSRSFGGNEYEENRSNPLDQIKSTCQNLFATITEKIAADLNLDLKPTASGQQQQKQNVHASQPRRTSNVRYQPPYFNNSIATSSDENRTNINSIQNQITTNNEQTQSPFFSSSVSSNTETELHGSGHLSTSTSTSSAFHVQTPSKLAYEGQTSDGNEKSNSNRTEYLEPSAAREAPTKENCDKVASNSTSNSLQANRYKKLNSDDEPKNIHCEKKYRSNKATVRKMIDSCATNSGCECSDEEIFTKFKRDYRSELLKNSIEVNDESNEEQKPGPSALSNPANDPSIPNTPIRDDVSFLGSSEISSFEDLGAVSGSNPNKRKSTTPCDTDNWQFVNKPIVDTSLNILLTDPTTSSMKPQRLTTIQLPNTVIEASNQRSLQINDSTFQTHSTNEIDRLNHLDNTLKKINSDKKISRRRSDGIVYMAGSSNTARRLYGYDPDFAGVHDNRRDEGAIRHEILRKSAKKSCHKCGKRKGDLQKHIARFRRELETTTSSTETEIKQQLDAFLKFLETHTRSSFELSDDTDSENDAEVSNLTQTDQSECNVDNTCQSEIVITAPDDEDDYDDDVGINVYGFNDETLSSQSPKRFFDLNEIETSEEIEELSVKQLKEVLMLNRIDFKGCCEKTELLERVQRLWNDLHNCPSIDKLPTDDLCKICMDAAIECVLLECGHMATCTNCGKVLSECPICRQYIVRVVRFFKA